MDNNSRFTLPDVLAQKYDCEMVLCPECAGVLRGYTREDWKKHQQQLNELDPEDDDDGDYLRVVRSIATVTAADANNRIKLSETQMKWLNIEGNNRDIVVYDMGKFMELLELRTWENYISDRRPRMGELKQKALDEDDPQEEQQQEKDRESSAGKVPPQQDEQPQQTTEAEASPGDGESGR